MVYLPIAYGGLTEKTTTTNNSEYISFVVPCGGYVDFVILRSEYNHKSTVVGLHKSSDNTELPSGMPHNTVTVNMVSDDISYKFIGGTSWGFSKGQTIAISMDATQSDSNYSGAGDITATIVLVLDWNDPL